MDVNQLTKITIAWELYRSGIPKSRIAAQLGVHRETVHLWVTNVDKVDLVAYLEQYTQAKKGERAKRKVDGLLKTRIWKLREENRDCCGQKIREYLKQEYKINLGVKAIYKVLKEKYTLRSKWKKNQVRGPVPRAQRPREVIQMDTVDFGEVFAFTGIDIFAKDVSVKLYPGLTSKEGLDFLIASFEERFKHTDLLQTDGGPEFKDEFKQKVYQYTDRFRVARPYKKNEQAYIEAFNRSLRKECLGWGKYHAREIPSLQKEVDSWMYYWHNDRVHLALDMKTPSQILQEYQVSDF